MKWDIRLGMIHLSIYLLTFACSWVGEEYDGGRYYGANAATSNMDVPWKHWLTNQNSSKPEDAALLLQVYP